MKGAIVAQYKYSSYLTPNSHLEFDAVYPPGTVAANAGIYRCTGCGDEIGIAKGHTLPAQNHRQHSTAQGAIRWQLLVHAEQR
jgi:hypothetical protein